MRIDILTLFPDMCNAYINESIIGRAVKNGIIEINCTNIRDYANNKHNKVDDTPYGGGMGMVMAAEPIYNAYKSLYSEEDNKPHLIYLSPKGETFTQKKAIELSNKEHIVLLCGHYEGIDERIIEEIVDEEISVGDYVLTGGELPALVVADAVSRMIQGVLADEICFTEESHFAGLLEYPQYTKPAVWHGRQVPDVLLSGHHANITKYRREKSLEETLKRRPEMLESAKLDKADLKHLDKLKGN